MIYQMMVLRHPFAEIEIKDIINSIGNGKFLFCFQGSIKNEANR
jgi:hypothetical protein